MTRARGLVGLLLALCLGLTGCGPASGGSSPTTAGAAAPHSSRTADRSGGAQTGLTPGQKDPDSGLMVVALSSLPPQAADTMRLIASNGPFPYRQDGVVYHNNNRVLPRHGDGYYHEYTVKTPGSPTRGARRIIHGHGNEYYWTADHYSSFQRIA